MMEPTEVNFVIYHDPCIDGFTSAMTCYYFNKSATQEDITFHPTNHGDKPPDVTGKNVLVCDFSYSKEDTNLIMKQANKLLVLDHHKTAEKELEDLPNENKVFDMNHSGAYLTWVYFFGGKNIPGMILYVEDHDLWLHKLDKTYEFTSFIFTVPKDFERYIRFLDDNYLDVVVFPMGEGMMIKDNNYKEDLAKKVVPHFIEHQGVYYFAGHLNSDILRSEIGNYAFKILPYLNFSVIIRNNGFANTTEFSLRSTDDRTDVSSIAKSFGGGGHRNAAGYNAPYIINNLPCKIIDEYQLYYILDNLFIIDQNNSRLAALNNATCSEQLVKYLMQERTPGVQEASFILMTKGVISKNIIFDGAVVFHMNDEHVIGYLQLKKDANIKEHSMFIDFNSDGLSKFKTLINDFLDISF